MSFRSLSALLSVSCFSRSSFSFVCLSKKDEKAAFLSSRFFSFASRTSFFSLFSSSFSACFWTFFSSFIRFFSDFSFFSAAFFSSFIRFFSDFSFFSAAFFSSFSVAFFSRTFHLQLFNRYLFFFRFYRNY